jgi:hypothetical protein
VFSVLVAATCDDHPDRPAVKRVQGETDSFGAEYIDMCQECLDAFRNRDTTEEQTGSCDWCGGSATDLRSRRDWEEGSSGPVYRVCGACVTKENKRMAEELDDYDFDN